MQPAPWPHQTDGVLAVLALINNGFKRIGLTSPTGGGKSRMIQELCRNFMNRGQGAVLFTNRRLLVDQLSASFSECGIDHGIRAAGNSRDDDCLMQISSIQTEASRVLKRQLWDVHPAGIAIFDEGHLHNNPQSIAIAEKYVNMGAVVLYVSATLLDMDDLIDDIVVAGTVSELQGYDPPALVSCNTYGPDEPDMKAFENWRSGKDLSEPDNVKAIMRPGIWGRVYGHWKRLNPDRRPTILFAPGVPESIWFAQHFAENGVRAAHIDGQHIWLDGTLHARTDDLWDEVKEGSKDGSIPVLCNRFVLREGIDLPWLSHGILACVFGSLQSYLQSGGRLLRVYPGKDVATIQDHGGNWWRHGSLNADREWHVGMTSTEAAARRADDFVYRRCRSCKAYIERGTICPQCKDRLADQPKACPECSRILLRGRCPGCGYAGTKFARQVVQEDGTLIPLTAEPFKPRRVYQNKDGPSLWQRMYYRARSPKWNATFHQAAALFAREQWSWPNPDWPLMPKNPDDWFRQVADVPKECLK